MLKNLITGVLIYILSIGLVACGNGKSSTESPTGANSNNSGTYNITGTITARGSALPGASVALSAGDSTSPTSSIITDANGAYSFSGAQNGSYNITPSMSGYTFAPTSTTVVVNGAHITG